VRGNPANASCPFCGEGARELDEIDAGVWAVCCERYKAIGPHCDGEQSPEQAVALWMRRHQAEAQI
jgi:hypothetical protein